MHPSRILGLIGTVAIFLAAVGLRAASPATVAVGIVQTADWVPGDSARDGAGAFAVLLRAAELKRSHDAVGLIALGDHNGMLRSGGERGLRQVALTGGVIVKVARGGSVGATP